MGKRTALMMVILMVFSLVQQSVYMLNSNKVMANEQATIENFQVTNITDNSVTLSWSPYEGADSYHVYWADKNTENMEYQLVGTVTETTFTFSRSTHVPYYFKVAAIIGEQEQVVSEVIKSPIQKNFNVQLENLDRGLVAAKTDEGIFLSWRLLADEVTAYSDYGLRGTDFNVYRDGELIATVENSTNYLDVEGDVSSEYYVSAVVDGVENGDISDTVTPWDDSYYDLPLQKPDDGVTPAGEAYTYIANDMSVGDVDGDGKYEFIVKWDPSNSKDVSQVGYTGNVYIDTYTFEGELLYRIDLGPNIRAGAHYTQFLVYDFDGDGKAELMFKTAPGTKVLQFDEQGNIMSEQYITMPQEDIDAGYSHDDDYRMSSENYYEYLVEVFMGWHEHEEVVNGNWPETLEESFGIEKQYTYPLSREDAESLVDYFMDVYAPERSERNNLRNFEGFILTGPEYLTVFEGATGQELQTIHYKPGRHDDGLMWGDYAMSRIEPGNRVDRFLAGVAYLDGEQPFAIFARGYYTRTTLVSYKWDGTKLEEHWFIDSGWTPMSNPFNDGPHGVPGTNPEYALLTTQGNHSLSTADVDGDGKQEIIYGASTIDEDGSVLYHSRDVLPEGSGSPGDLVGLGHGDALHVADINPDRPGLEIYSVFEGGPWAPYGYALRDAETGEVIYGEYTGRDTGRGMIGDVNRGRRGLETWATNLRTADGELISTSMPGTNMNIKWSADMSTQIVNGSREDTPTIDDWERGRLLTANGTRTNNDTKGNPSLVADIFGDWREELLVRTTDSTAIRIYLSTEETDRKLHTLMHDIQYRTGIAWQNVAYNQPAYPSYYFATDIDWEYVYVANAGELEYVEEVGPEIDVSALENLIAEAKAISNDRETYTEVTFQALQEAISEAEDALDKIIFENQLHAALDALQRAIDSLEEIVDLGPGWRFDFGSEHSPVANGYLQVTDQMIYDPDRGYGFVSAADGNRDQDGPDDLRRDFVLANNSEFIVDVPNGEYDVRIITGSNWDSDTAFYSLEGGEVKGGIRTDAGEFMEYTDTVTVNDGQLNIAFSGTWARINAVEIVAVKDFNVKFDFGSANSPVAYGYKQVSNTMVYDADRGYGLNKAVNERDRGNPDDIRRDFVIDDQFQFIVDLRDGTYLLNIIAGDDIASNTSTFSVDGEQIGRISSGAGEYGELAVEVTVIGGQLVLDISQRINGLEIYYVPDEEIDTTPLNELIAEAKALAEDGRYTTETVAILKQAIETALQALDSISSEDELGDVILSLQEAIGQLEEIDDGDPDPKDPEEPTDPPTELEIDLQESVEIVAGQLVKVKDSAISIQMPANLPEGTIITITLVDDEEIIGENVVAGDVISVDLQLPEGEEGYEGEYILTLGIDVEALDEEIAIFYYNEETEEWENKGGEIDRKTQTISTTVNHFSTYGVLVDPAGEGDPDPKDPTPVEPDDQDSRTDDENKAPPTIEDDEDLGEDDKDNKLPKTATTMFTMLWVGSILLILGGLIHFIMNRKRFHV